MPVFSKISRTYVKVRLRLFLKKLNIFDGCPAFNGNGCKIVRLLFWRD